MPILNRINEVFIIYKNEKISAKILYETENKIAFSIVEDHPFIEKLKNENRLDFEAKQGNYDCYFQSKINYFGIDLLKKQFILEIDYPPVFRRVIKTY